MKERIVFGILILLILAICLLVTIAVSIYATRLQSASTIEKVTEHEDGFDLYRMDVKYNYHPDRILRGGFKDDQAVADAILKEALPHVHVHMDVPEYGCSAFSVRDRNGKLLMGRNYDFTNDTSGMVVFCRPRDGYASVGLAALDHLQLKEIKDYVDELTTMPCPFICLDGMNEKGVSICVLWMDSEPTRQKTGKPQVFTTMAIRLVLDRAASTHEAVKLLRGYDMFAVSGGDYQFFITDSSGDARVIEFDCHSETRELRDIPARTASNFYQLYKDKVLPNQNNGIYGHGRERYERIEEILSANEDDFDRDAAWQALRAAEQLPTPEDVTSNTQWSVIYNDTDLTAEVTFRRRWGETYKFSLND